MSIKLTDIILGCTKTFNGHNDLEIEGMTFPIKDIMLLCEELQEALEEREGYTGCVYYKVYLDGGGSVYAGDYFKDHVFGHRDKLLVTLDMEV